mgnify:CR=1 FL=1
MLFRSQMIKDIQRSDLIDQLREHGYTDDDLQAMDYRELKTKLGIEQLTDDELKTRYNYF